MNGRVVQHPPACKAPVALRISILVRLACGRMGIVLGVSSYRVKVRVHLDDFAFEDPDLEERSVVGWTGNDLAVFTTGL